MFINILKMVLSNISEGRTAFHKGVSVGFLGFHF